MYIQDMIQIVEDMISDKTDKEPFVWVKQAKTI